MLIHILPALLVLMPVPGQGSAKPFIAVSPNVKEGGTMADLVKDLQDLRKLGLDGQYISVKWSDLEPVKDKLNLKAIDDPVRGLGGMGFTMAVTLQTLDTNNRTLPSDLMDKPFDSLEMRERFDAMIRVIAPRLTPSVKWVMLGNEVDAYLGMHRGEIIPYLATIERGRELLRSLKPGLKVGVTCTFGGATGDPKLFELLNRNMDVVSLTYYPLKPDFSVQPVDVVPGDIARMVRMAGSKPLLIQEIGYPADPLLGSSDEKQAAFVDAVFDAAKGHKDRIVMVNYFLLVDFNNSLLEMLLKYYRLPNAKFRAYLATLGLKRADGTPRKSWDRFQARLRTF